MRIQGVSGNSGAEPTKNRDAKTETNSIENKNKPGDQGVEKVRSVFENQTKATREKQMKTEEIQAERMRVEKENARIAEDKKESQKIALNQANGSVDIRA